MLTLSPISAGFFFQKLHFVEEYKVSFLMNYILHIKIGAKFPISILPTIITLNSPNIHVELNLDHLVKPLQHRANFTFEFQQADLSDPCTIINKCDRLVKSSKNGNFQGFPDIRMHNHE